MSLLEKLGSKKAWKQFYDYKAGTSCLGKKRLKQLKDYIDNKGYLKIAEKIIEGSYVFHYPVKTFINKRGKSKKRTIYRFSYKESNILKLIAFLLYKYDGKLSPGCYSFRRSLCVQTAVRNIIRLKKKSEKYILKVDIRDYFNSAVPEKLAADISSVIDDDWKLAKMLKDLVLTGKSCLHKKDGKKYQIIEESCGAMAGVPVSAFFANIYLMELDRMFYEKKVPYFRYSDDILVFCDTKENLEEYKSLIFNFIEDKGLEVNTDKLRIYSPGEKYEFLGFSFDGDEIDIAEASLQKIKARIKRRAKSLFRRRKKAGESFDMVAADLADFFNRKFYDDENDDGFTWSRWYFPLLTTAKSLKIIDGYLEQYMRFLSTGRHTKRNFLVRYDELKELGFRSLVNEYYKMRWHKRQLPES